MKRFFKRVTSIMAAVMMLFNSLPTGALAAQGSFGATTNLRGATAANQPTNDYNFKSILGNGVYFGITANKLEQQNHLQTNFAVNSYTNQNDAGTKPNLSGNSAGMFYIGSVDGNRMVPENDSGEFFIFTSSGEDKFLKHGGKTDQIYILNMDKNEIKNDVVNPIISHGRSVSNTMAQKPATMTVSGNEIDTTKFEDNVTIYIDADNINFSTTGGITIKKKANQVIVFNFKSSNTVNIAKYKIVVDGQYYESDTDTSQTSGNKAKDKIAQTIVWNCNKASQVNVGTMLGIVLAPNGNVTVGGNNMGSSSAGWIIAGGTVKNQNAEWHGIYQEMPDVHKINVVARKTVNGDDAVGTEKFNFSLERYNHNTKKWETVGEQKANSAASIEFSNIKLPDNTSGWVVYRIKETGVNNSTPNKNKYTTSSKTYYAAVYVKEYGSTKKVRMPGPVKYYQTFNESTYNSNRTNTDANRAGLSNPVSNNLPVFDNTKADETQKLDLVKKITNRTFKNGDKFTFTIQQKSGDTKLPKDAQGNDITSVTLQINNNQAGQNAATVSFGEFQFNKKDFEKPNTNPKQYYTSKTYTYELRETAGDNKGFIYDDHVETITLKATYNEGTNSISLALETDKDGIAFNNTFRTTTVSGQKKWNLKGASTSYIPESITVNIKNGPQIVDTLTVRAGQNNNWEFTSKELPMYSDDGKTLINYTIDEVVPDGFDKRIDGSVITNNLKTKVIRGEKIWDLKGNDASLLPEQITVYIKDGNTTVDTLTVKAGYEGRWSFTSKEGRQDRDRLHSR